jgi:hypothetical protein
MLKFIFGALLAANALLFAYQQGYLEALLPSGREPARMRNQLNADKIGLVAAPAPNALSPAAASGIAPVAASSSGQSDKTAQADKTAPTDRTAAAACTEIGNFTPSEAKRFEARLASSPLAGKFSRSEIHETSSHMVLIPSRGNREEAERKTAELREMNIHDYYIIQDNSNLRWAISLGIFRSEEAARAHLDTLFRKGVRNAQLVEYKVPLTRVVFQLRGLGKEGSDIEKIKADFPRQEMRACA